MGVAARSSHGTLIAHAPVATGVFATISEIGDIGDLGTSRNATDVSVHNEDIDTWILGIMRRDVVSFPVNYVAADATHIALLESHWNNDVDGWRATWPDLDVMIFSGGISAMGKPAPVDGALRQNISIRPSGLFSYNGEIIGAVE